MPLPKQAVPTKYFVLTLAIAIPGVVIYRYFHLDWPAAKIGWGNFHRTNGPCKFFTVYFANERIYGLDDDYIFVRYNPKDPIDCCAISFSFPFAQRVEAHGLPSVKDIEKSEASIHKTKQ